MSPTAAHLVDLVIPRVPVRQWVLSLPIPLRLLLAAQPVLVTPVLQVVHRVFTRDLLEQTGFKADQADSGAVTLIQRFGSAANLNIHLHCLVLDGAYRRTDREPVFVQADSPTDEELRAQKVFTVQGAMPHDAARDQDLCADHQGNSAARGRALRCQRAPVAGPALPLHHPTRTGQ